MASLNLDTLTYVGPIAGVIALLFAGFLASSILRHSKGNARMQEIQSAVREGAFAFLKVEYQVVAIFTVILTVVFAAVGMFTGDSFWYYTAVGFVVGAVLSALAGYIGMWISVSSNARVAEAARKGLKEALALSFRAGAVNGFAVVGLGIIGLGVLYIIFRAQIGPVATPLHLIGFAFGASLITLFARIAGGIYTKAADVGADLVGKVEAGIPEDDPRNPAVIADNVGDNVGDCAGMGADLFETYVVTLVAAMTLAATSAVFSGGTAGFTGYGEAGILFPLTLGAFAIVASILGIFFVRLPKSGNIMNALYAGMIATVAVSAIGFAAVWAYIFPEIHVNFLFASFIGLILTLALVFVTDYFTSQGYKPVKGIVDASTTGPATNIIQGLAVGLQSVFIPVLFVVGGIVFSFLLGEFVAVGLGLYGVAMAAVGMLSVAGMVVALDTYGPITDNAGGVAEMSELPPEVRKVTDALDAVGNTTKATTKGYAIGSAALAALVLFADFVDHANVERVARGEAVLTFDISNPFVLSGLLLGAAVVFLFASYAMAAVGRAAHAVVTEVRRQFADGEIMAGRRKPDYQTCVAIVTKAALKEMVVPGSLAVAAPLLVGFILGAQALGGMIMGTIVGGFALALLMSNAGGAWDNAKKSFESGIHGGKGSDAHKAAVVGDTVGDPFKDTAGPAINPLIKAMTTISVIFAGLVVAFSLVQV
ncbi:MAG TPA: sodium-translocating pyrophosphatase [Candidatus Thermoplasmatota archaeon]|nr:sodium-translocating pyrophosphatase [Candidatus Thermoplasmatota archaeon]